MATITMPTRTSISAIRELAEDFHEPSWRRTTRLAAWGAAQSLPYPDRADETWRQVDLTKIPVAEYAPAEPTLPAFSGTALGDGVVCANWATALAQHPTLIQQHFMQRALRPDEHKFLAWHAACLNGAAVIYVPRNIRVPQPLVVRWAYTGAERGYFPHLLLVAEEGSQVSVLEEYTSPDGTPALSVTAAEIIVGSGAHVTYGAIQQWGDAVTHFGWQRMRLARDAQAQSVLLSTGAHLARLQLESVAHEPGSSSDLLGFRIGRGTQQCHIVSLQDHQAPQTTSDLLFKSALHDSAQGSYYGTIRIQKSAQKCNAYQADRTLLLGEHAKADSTPILEIEADDVRCTHGASMGPVEEEPLFYLRSRGIPPEIAQTMLVYGFFEDALARLRDSSLREAYTQRLAAAVGSLELVQQETL